MAPLRRSPTLTTLALMLGVFALQVALGVLGRALRVPLALSAPVDVAPWTVVTSIYAHAGPGHLVANAVALLFVGLLIERETTPARFHLFFVATGALTGLAEVWFAAALGPVVPWIQPNVAVLGASGAIFALIGYLLTGNRLTERVAGRVRLSPRVQLLLFLLLAGAITWYTGSPGVALVSHFTGLLLGLLAGRAHLLRR
jgi:membrane associated rhomboid family serine protease